MKKILFKSKNNFYNKNDIIGVCNSAEFENIDIGKIRRYAFNEPSIKSGTGMNFSNKLALMYELGVI